MTGEKVVFLAYSNPKKLEHDARDLLACKTCRNKAWSIVFQGEAAFPLLQCTACGQHAGYWGFAGEDQPDLNTTEEPPKGDAS